MWIPGSTPSIQWRFEPITDLGSGPGIIPAFMPIPYQYFLLFCGSQYGGAPDYEQRRHIERIRRRLAYGGVFERGDLLFMLPIRWWSPQARAYVRRFQRRRRRIDRKMVWEESLISEGPEDVPVEAMTLPQRDYHRRCVRLMETGPLTPPSRLLLR
jgi:hypothetical protein